MNQVQEYLLLFITYLLIKTIPSFLEIKLLEDASNTANLYFFFQMAIEYPNKVIKTH